MESAQREAQSSFGHREVYLERYLTWPRHIEMQVLRRQPRQRRVARRAGLLGQRRHQKLIEESPAPHCSPMRSAGPWARPRSRSRKACGYENAGTVEFLYEDGELLLPRDEHPPAGRAPGHRAGDRPRPRRVADPRRGGRAARLSQEDHRSLSRGHAIEARINAEDPAGGRFRPSPGTITKLRLPEGPGCGSTPASRPATRSASTTTTWSPRSSSGATTARPPGAGMLRAIVEMEVEGVATTIPARRGHPHPSRFRRGPTLDPLGGGDLDLSAIVASTAAEQTSDEFRHLAAGEDVPAARTW